MPYPNSNFSKENSCYSVKWIRVVIPKNEPWKETSNKVARPLKEHGATFLFHSSSLFMCHALTSLNGL